MAEQTSYTPEQIKRIQHLRDQLRIRNIIGKITTKHRPSLIKSKKKELKATPGFKKHRRREMAEGAGALGGTAGLTGLLTSKGWKKGLGAAGVGAGLGALYGYGRSRRALSQKAKTTVNKQIRGLLTREAGKTFKAHALLSRPGTQVARMKRPWGVETYRG
jgi:hypothetical protein